MNHAAQPLPSRDDSRPESGGRRRISVLLVDDYAVVREGLRRILSQRRDMVIVGEAADGDEALALVSRRRPDVVVMDAGLPGVDGFEATRRICSAHPGVRVVMFVDGIDEETDRTARANGATGVLCKDAAAAAVATAIAQVAAGRLYADPRVDPSVLATRVAPTQRVLSGREQQILQLLAEGCTNREVGERLVLGSETVKTHVAHILTKLKAGHSSQAVAIGLRDGLIR
jgi:DNA-binding NarL/FixJ family response regulator